VVQKADIVERFRLRDLPRRKDIVTLKTLVIEVEPQDDGRTLQAVLRDRAAISHSEARGLIDAGAVRGPAPIRPGDYARRVATGERYEVQREEGRR